MSSPSVSPDTAAVVAVLADELALRGAEVAALDARLTADVARLTAFSGRGKMLRSQFLCWGYRAVPRHSGSIEPTGPADPLPRPVVRAAAALELIQACALMHDDIIDRSDTRRGSPTTHVSVAKEHADASWAGDGTHYGVSIALLLGDLALAWADDLFVDAAIGSGAADQVLPIWRAMRTEVLAGQLLDLRVSADLAEDPIAAEHDATQVNRLKTAAYTVVRPLQLGAALAGASDPTLAALREYGTAVGLAFQLRDDQLGVFGEPAVTGKPSGGDLIEGKRTVLLARARTGLAASPADLAELDGAIGTPMGQAQVARVTQLVAASGASGQVSAMIEELVATGTAALRARDEDGRPVVHAATAQALLELAERSGRRPR